MSYAQNTNVSVERSQIQIKETLRRYGADRFGVMEDDSSAVVMFQVQGITVRIDVPLRSTDDPAFWLTETGRDRSDASARKAYEQDVRSRWRKLLLAVKAKLEAVESGISTIEKEFLPFMVMPDGQTVADHILPRIDEAVRLGRMPQLLALPAATGGGS
jgi:hypothetical protein